MLLLLGPDHLLQLALYLLALEQGGVDMDVIAMVELTVSGKK